MRPILSFLFLVAFTLACWITSGGEAYAARLSLVGVANSSTPNEPGTSYTGETTYGGGVLLEMRMIPMFGLELGALYAPRKYTYSVATPAAATYTLTGAAYEFPVLLRLHMGRTFSFGVGGYYTKAKGDLNLATSANGTTTSQTATYKSQNQTEDDYGIATSLSLAFRLTPLTHLLIDGRYLIGMKNDSLVASGSRKFNDMELLAGLQFGF